MNVTLENLKDQWESQDGRCALTGVEMEILPTSNTRGREPLTPWRASLDRIDNLVGYEPGNIRWICVMANYCRNRFSDEDVRHFAASMQDPNNERSIVSGEATGVLEILPGDTDTSGIKRFEWNGDADDRAAARTAFEEVVAYGGVLATVVDAPGHATQVRTFDEVEEIERERGTVAVQVSRQIVGG